MLFLGRMYLRNILPDQRQALEEVRQSHLEWVVVRPLALVNEPAKGSYRVALDGLPPLGRRIARADVAQFMLASSPQRSTCGRYPPSRIECSRGEAPAPGGHLTPYTTTRALPSIQFPTVLYVKAMVLMRLFPPSKVSERDRESALKFRRVSNLSLSPLP